jgi:hypothetical protein
MRVIARLSLQKLHAFRHENCNGTYQNIRYDHGRRKVNILGEAIRLQMRLYFFLSFFILPTVGSNQKSRPKKFPVLSVKLFSARGF